MISEKMEAALNKQINAEMFSSYLYLSMGSYFQSINLEGSANWMKAQALEEMYHGMKLHGYLEERGGRFIAEAIEKPESKWDSPLAAFEAVYAHEQKVTGLINDLLDLAIELKDHASTSFLQWFIEEQVEEEATADGIVQKIKLAGPQGSGMFMIDSELGQRIFNLPADVKLAIQTSKA
jgi:ferritin